MLNLKSVVRLGLAASLSVAAMCAAHAQVTFTLSGPGPSSQNVTVSNNGGAGEGTATGPYLATINGVQNIPIFCTDLTHNINFGGGYTALTTYRVTDGAGAKQVSGYYNGGLASAITGGDFGSTFVTNSATAAQRASEVAWLADNYLLATTATFSNNASGDKNVANNESGVSLAIWNIIQNGVNGGVTSDHANFNTLATYYENQSALHSSYKSTTVSFIQAPMDANGGHLQDFIAIYPVPEPSIFVTGLSMFGITGIGLVRGRRRSARKAA